MSDILMHRVGWFVLLIIITYSSCISGKVSGSSGLIAQKEGFFFSF